MKLDISHIILIVIIIVILIWFLSENRTYERFDQNRNQNMSEQMLTAVIKLSIDHMFYERLLMITYFTNKSNLHKAETDLINNVKDISQFIRDYHQDLSELSDFIDKNFIGNLDPYFALIYKFYDCMELGNNTQQARIIRELNTIVYNIAAHFDKLLGTNITRKYTLEYMKLYIPSIFSYLSRDQLRDTQYMHAMFNLGIDYMFNLMKIRKSEECYDYSINI